VVEVEHGYSDSYAAVRLHDGTIGQKLRPPVAFFFSY
jgi:hypothetical protein